MIITITDPITGEHPHNLNARPFVVEGVGRLAVKIYFQSEESRTARIDEYFDKDKTRMQHSH